MFNSSLDAYGSVKRLAAVQNIAGSQNALVKPIELSPAVNVENKQPTEVDKTALTAAVKKLNELVAPALQTIQFAVEQESERMVVKVVDTATNKVLRQMPNDEVLAFSKTLDRLQGLVVRQTA